MTEYNKINETGAYIHFSALSDVIYIGDGVWGARLDGQLVTVDDDDTLLIDDKVTDDSDEIALEPTRQARVNSLDTVVD